MTAPVPAEITAASLVPLIVTTTDRSGAVGGANREGLGQRLAGASAWMAGLRVRGGVGPDAVGAQREGAIGAGRSGLRLEDGLARIGIGDGQRATGGDVAAGDADVFGDRAGAGGDHRRIVGAVDRDDDRRSGAVGRSER